MVTFDAQCSMWVGRTDWSIGNESITHTWQLREARSRFGELVDRVLAEGARLVTHRGAAVVVIAAPEYRRLSAGPSLLAVLNGAPRGEAPGFPVPLKRCGHPIGEASARHLRSVGIHQQGAGGQGAGLDQWARGNRSACCRDVAGGIAAAVAHGRQWWRARTVISWRPCGGARSAGNQAELAAAGTGGRP
ncbi:MAG: type II toxin-antitoxin system Phd/YefM family antitoxin [Sulfuritalea sp.]|nr:type II toxin-antitoxin system Phd/YefM family antitoxin [Sulfuritalea sp.]